MLPFGYRHRVTVVVPTIGNPLLAACVASLERQSFTDMEVVVVDNSGSGEARRILPADTSASLMENSKNAGFGGAINQAFSAYPAEFLATLNDDAEASPQWLEQLVRALDSDPGAGMAASLVLLAESNRVDSAGMLIARDGSSKQRGHTDPIGSWASAGEALCPSGSAAIYRGKMLELAGLFEESFFLYCEDTDLGLRARWAGWRCPFVPAATVRHNYSASAGRASPLKAWLVERNRLRVAVRCLPGSWLALAPLASAWRYFWHVVSVFEGRGKAAEFSRVEGGPLRMAAMVLRAHFDLLREMPRLWRQRRSIQSGIDPSEMANLLSSYLISLREVARL